MNVDFPHPDGPMIAVACLSGNEREMSWTAWVLPYQALRFWTTSLSSLTVMAHTPAGRGAARTDPPIEGAAQNPRA